MRKIVGLGLSILFLLACTDQKPKNLLPQPDMTDLLYELALVGAIESSSFQQDTVYITQTPKNLLAKYNLDSLSFVEQHRYYLKYQPQVYVEMFDSIQQRFLRKAEEYNSSATKTPQKLLAPVRRFDTIVPQSAE